MDVAGEQQIDVVSNIIKTRRDYQGNKLGVELDETHMRARFAGRCGPCFPHLTDMHEPPDKSQCCNSCDDVKTLYAQKDAMHSQLKWEQHPLCQHEAVLLDPARLTSIHEGCNLFGFLDVNKVAGNFHLAPGKSYQSPGGQLVHEFKAFDAHKYNVSHLSLIHI